MDLTQEIYSVTETFPKTEIYGLTSQLRRCAVSIPSNIAEGAGRSTNRDFAMFIGVARGSSYELETQVLIAARLGFIDEARAMEILDASAEIGRLLKGLLVRLRSNS